MMNPDLSRRLGRAFNMPSFADWELRRRILEAAEMAGTWEDLPEEIQAEIVAHENDHRTWREVLAEERAARKK